MRMIHVMLCWQMALLARFVSVLVPSRGGHWLEGDRGTLVLGSDNQKDYVHGFPQGTKGQPLAEVQIPGISPFLKLTLMVASHRLSESRAGCKELLEARHCLSAGRNLPQLMDLTHESDATGCWCMCDLNAFLAVSS